MSRRRRDERLSLLRDLQSRPDLLDRLREGEDVETVEVELRRREDLQPGRPPLPVDELTDRAAVANAIYNGTLPSHLSPSDLRSQVSRAQGSRELADTVAGQLLNLSRSSVAQSRRRSRVATVSAVWRAIVGRVLNRDGETEN